MALDRSIVTIPLAQGLATKADAKQIPPGRLTALENGVFTTLGQLRKRYGHSALGTSIYGGGTLASGAALHSLDNRLVLHGAASGTTPTNLYSYSSAQAAWASNGTMVRADVARIAGFRPTASATKVASAVHSGGVACLVYQSSVFVGGGQYNLGITLLDTATGAILTSVALDSGAGLAKTPKVAVLGSNFVVVWGETDSTVSYRTVSLTGTVSSATTLVSGSGFPTTCAFDLVTNAAGTRCYLAYPTATGADISLRYLDSGLVLSSAVTVGVALGYNHATYVALSELGAGGNILLATAADTVAGAVYLSEVSTSLTVVTAKVTADAAAGTITYLGGGSVSGTLENLVLIGVAGGSAVVYWTVASTSTVETTTRTIKYYAVTAGTLAVGAASYIRNQFLASVPFQVGSSYFLVTGVNAGGTGRLVYNLSTGDIAAKVAAIDGAGYFSDNTPGTGAVPRPTVMASGAVYFGLCVAFSSRAESGSIAVSTGADLAKVTFPTTPVIATDIGGVLVYAAGITTAYDGATTTELGFLHAPAGLALTGSGTGGSLSAGSYGYCVVYEWMDGNGAIHRSAPSPVASVTTTGGTSKVTVEVPTLRITKKASPRRVSIVIYRTLADLSVYYRLTTINNDSSVDSLSYEDTGASDISGNQILYTTGSVLEAEPPPTFSAMTVYRNRIVGINAENPYQIWFSQQVIPGQPIEFSSFLTLNVDTGGGPLTGLEVLDDKLILFKASTVYYITGSGPDSTGGNSDFSVPILINANSGAVEPRSIITAGPGLFYRSQKGFYLMGRSLEDKYIGADVEAWNQSTVLGAQVVPNTNEVRFPLSNGDVLVYDFFADQWAAHTGLSPAATAVLGTTHCVLRSTGAVWSEDSSVFTDAGTAYALRVKTGWLGAGDLQSFLRVYRLLLLGDFKSAHSLTVKVGYDYETTQTTYTLTQAAAGTDAYQWRVNLARQKCEAVQIELLETPTGGTSESVALSALSFLVGGKRGGMKLPSARAL